MDLSLHRKREREREEREGERGIPFFLFGKHFLLEIKKMDQKHFETKARTFVPFFFALSVDIFAEVLLFV